MAKRLNLSSAVLIGSLLHAGTVAALGLGDITLNSFLNEPLDAEVRLIDTRDLVADEIKVRLAESADFERMGVERSYFLTRIQFEVSIDRERNSGVIRLTTDEPVREPFVDVIIEARWPAGRLLREYTVLVDPPVFREEPLTVSASDAVSAAETRAPESDDPPEPETPGSGASPEASSVESGDRVSMGRGDLPPGEMPRRAFSAQTSDVPVPGERYMVRRDETLWQIASRARPEGSSVQQAMLDIQRLNPEAFIDGNINRIKAGYIVYLPSASDISSDNLAEALAEVQQQNARWSGQQAPTPGVTGAASLRISADAEADDGRAEEAATAAVDAGAARSQDPAVDQQSPTSEDAPSAPGGSGVSADEGIADESSAGGETAQGKLAAQLAGMSERLDTLEQIVALKDEQIAALEESLREARAAAASPADAAVTGQAAQPPTQPQPTPTQTQPTPASSEAGPEGGAPSGGMTAWLYAAVGVLLAALLGFLFWRRRRETTESDDEAMAPITARDEAADNVFAGVKLREEPPAPPPRNDRGYGERRYDDYIDDSGGGDALAEADIYIAYGRYLQAAELLNTAIEAEPDSTAYRLKLIELYVDMGEPAEAEQQLTALRELDDSDAVRRGEAIVGARAPESPASPPAPEPEPEPEPEAEPEAKPEAEPEPEPELEREPEPYSELEPQPEPETETEPAVPARGASDTRPYADAGSDVETGYGQALEEIEYEPLEFSLDEIDASDDDIPENTTAAATPAPGQSPGDADVTELELDFDELAIEDDEPAAAAAVGEDELDLSEALREAEAPEEQATEASGSDERDSEDMMFASDSDQVATRLDLARAYLDMGDDEGARRILEQVITAGTDEQQRDAQALLDRIG